MPDIDVLPQQGANVYDILRRDTLVLTTRRRAAARSEAEMTRRPGNVERDGAGL